MTALIEDENRKPYSFFDCDRLVSETDLPT